MALHPSLPRSPYAPLDPAHRWFPAGEALRASAEGRLARRYQRHDQHLEALDARALPAANLPLRSFAADQTRDIVFKTMLDGEPHLTVQLDGAGLVTAA